MFLLSWTGRSMDGEEVSRSKQGRSAEDFHTGEKISDFKLCGFRRV